MPNLPTSCNCGKRSSEYLEILIVVYQAITSRTMKLEPDVLEKKRAFIQSRLARGCISVSKFIIFVRRGAFFNDILYVLMFWEMSDSLEYILACQICLEDFEETGEHVPRILPCHHSLCEKCLKELIEKNFVECPECRKRHRVVDNEVKTFPQNKYILANIRKKGADIVKNDQTSETRTMCDRHGKELILYCKGPECLISICQTCLTRHHRGHDVVEIEEAEKEALFKKIEVFVKDLEERKGNILEVKKNIEEDSMECVKKITARKEELSQKINQRYEQMLAKVKQEWEK